MKSNDLRTEKLLYIRNLHCTFLKHGFIGHSVHVDVILVLSRISIIDQQF